MNMYVYKCLNEHCRNEEFLEEQPEYMICPICKQAMRGPLVVSLDEDVDDYDIGDHFEPYDDNRDYGIDNEWKKY